MATESKTPGTTIFVVKATKDGKEAIRTVTPGELEELHGKMVGAGFGVEIRVTTLPADNETINAILWEAAVGSTVVSE